MDAPSQGIRALLSGLTVVLFLATPAGAERPPEQVTLTLAEAVDAALAQNRALLAARVDSQTAAEQVRQAWGGVYPRLDGTVRYTRWIDQPSPFSGSDAGGFFDQLAVTGWLAFNEAARTDGDPTTDPISLQEFQARQAQGLSDAGVDLSTDDNPFFVPNQFQLSLDLVQPLFDSAAFAAIDGAEAFEQQVGAQIAATERQIVLDVVRAWYGALLAEAQEAVLTRSAERASAAVDEVRSRVEQGVLPKFALLSAEVELANIETRRLEATNAARSARGRIAFALGLPVQTKVRIRGGLRLTDEFDWAGLNLDAAYGEARERRPDLKATRRGVEVLEVRQRISRSGYWPVLSAFASLGAVGNVPDDREVLLSDPTDPFAFDTREESFFSDAYWGPNINVGVQLQWNLFNGFATSAVAAQDELAITQARLRYDEQVFGIEYEISRAVRDLRAANMRIEAQNRNVDRAQTNYEHARVRVSEGVSTPAELREASQQLDESELLQLSALHDYLVAHTTYEYATGAPLKRLVELAGTDAPEGSDP